MSCRCVLLLAPVWALRSAGGQGRGCVTQGGKAAPAEGCALQMQLHHAVQMWLCGQAGSLCVRPAHARHLTMTCFICARLWAGVVWTRVRRPIYASCTVGWLVGWLVGTVSAVRAGLALAHPMLRLAGLLRAAWVLWLMDVRLCLCLWRNACPCACGDTERAALTEEESRRAHRWARTTTTRPASGRQAQHRKTL